MKLKICFDSGHNVTEVEKSSKYWPDLKDQVETFGHISVHLRDESRLSHIENTEIKLFDLKGKFWKMQKNIPAIFDNPANKLNLYCDSHHLDLLNHKPKQV